MCRARLVEGLQCTPAAPMTVMVRNQKDRIIPVSIFLPLNRTSYGTYWSSTLQRVNVLLIHAHNIIPPLRASFTKFSYDFVTCSRTAVDTETDSALRVRDYIGERILRSTTSVPSTVV
jgi:hypothetical protein